MAIVYQHRRLDTLDVFYVGIGKDKRRAYSKKRRNPHWHNVVEKLGYIVEILYKGVSWEAACEIEKKYIKHYGRKDLGLGTLVNMTDGGEGGKNPSDESRKKMSEAKKGRKQNSEHIEKRTLAIRGKKRTQETRKKISDVNKIKVIQLNKINNEIIKIWDSIIEASEQLNINASHITSVCKNNRKTTGGFKWKYYES